MDGNDSPTGQWASVWDRVLGGDHDRDSSPTVVGIAGGVASGKSTAARALMLSSSGTVTVMAMDDFLMSNEELERRGLSDEKGFPHTYNVTTALECLNDLRAGQPTEVSVYSHERYDIVAEHRQILSPAETIVVEGLHVLGDDRLRAALDCSVFLDTDLGVARDRYLRRFRSLRSAAADDPRSFYRWALDMDDETSEGLVAGLWDSINLPNYERFIAPTIRHADHLVTQGPTGPIDLRTGRSGTAS